MDRTLAQWSVTEWMNELMHFINLTPYQFYWSMILIYNNA